MKNTSRFTLVAFSITLIAFLFLTSVVGVIIYVAIHFLSKVW